MIASLGQLGKTVFLTTHYMDEAHALADRVAILARGEIVAQGPPDQLSGDGATDTVIAFRLPAGTDATEIPATFAASAQVDGRAVSVTTHKPLPLIDELSSWAVQRGVDLLGLEVRRPSLEDTYLRLVAEADAEEARAEGSE